MMDFKEGALWGLDRAKGFLHRSLDGLTQQQAAWRACGNCNSIASMVIHLGRVEDTWTHRILGGKDIWETDGWAQKFGLPIEDRGWTFDKQSAQEQQPLSELVNYYEATHRLLVEFIEKLPVERLAESPQNPMNLTVEQIFSHIVIEESQHVGQIDYLKGMQNSQAS